MEHFFQGYEIRFVFVDQGPYVIADFEESLVCITLFWPNRAAEDTILFVYDAVTGSRDPRVDAD